MIGRLGFARRLYEGLLRRVPLPAAGPESRGAAGLQTWRQRVLAAILLAGCLLGAPAYLVNVGPVLRAGQWTLAIIYTAAYAWVLAVSLSRRFSFNVRAASVLVLLYGLGLVAMLAFGLAGDGRLWLLAFTLMATVLLGLWSGLGALALSVATVAAVGALVVTGRLTGTAGAVLDPASPVTWASTSAVLFLLAMMGSLSLAVVTRGLDHSLKQERALIDELELERSELRQRTRDLERRLTQIRSAAEISRALSGVLDIETLLRQVVRLLGERAQLHFVGVYLLDASGETAVLRAAAGAAREGVIQPEPGPRLAVDGATIVGWAISQRQPRSVADLAQEALPLGQADLPLARSALALPLLRRDKVHGALVVLSDQPGAFDRDDAAVMQGVADGLAIALENARLVHELQDSLEEIQGLHQRYLSDTWAERARDLAGLSYTFKSDQPPAAPGELSELQVPLMLRQQVIGSLTLEIDRRTWTGEDMALLESVTAQAALALENARLFEETRRRASHERRVAEITAKVRASTDTEAIVRTAISELGRALNASEGVIRLGVGRGASES